MLERLWCVWEGCRSCLQAGKGHAHPLAPWEGTECLMLHLQLEREGHCAWEIAAACSLKTVSEGSLASSAQGEAEETIIRAIPLSSGLRKEQEYSGAKPGV